MWTRILRRLFGGSARLTLRPPPIGVLATGARGRFVLRVALLLGLIAAPTAVRAAQCQAAGGLPDLNRASDVRIALGRLGEASGLQTRLSDLAIGPTGVGGASCGNRSEATAPPEPASLGAPQPSIAAGNPVDVVSGAKHGRVVDVMLPAPDSLTRVAADGRADPARVSAAPIPGDPLVMAFARHYDSTRTYSLAFGPGWSHSFETRLARQVQAGGRVRLQILQGDGRRILFDERGAVQPPHAGRLFASPDSQDGLIEERDEALGRRWIWSWPTGRQIEFDARGRLRMIETPDRDRLELTYGPDGRVDAIADRHGRRLSVEYRQGRLSALELPEGRRISYLYDALRRLVGVRYPDGRLLRYHYEDRRADHRLTGVTETDGAHAAYRYDEQGRVIESRPAGALAADALRLSYHGSAQSGYTEVRWRTTVTRYHRETGSGIPMLVRAEGDGCPVCPPTALAYQRDPAGRLTAQGPWRMRYDRHGRLIALTQALGGASDQWRIQYAGEHPLARPERIESPSVVPGRSRVLELAHNERGQLTRWSESGFSPEPGGARAIYREYRYTYQQGGPAEGKLIAIEQREGRPGSGTPSRTIGLDWTPQRTLQAVRYPQAIEHRIERDRWARPIAETLPDGARIERDFDAGGHLSRLRTPERTLRFIRSFQGVLERVEFGDGERWTFAYHPDRLLLSTASGRLFRWAIDRDGRSLAAPAPAPGVKPLVQGLSVLERTLRVIDADGRLSEFVRDDFGRTILERSSQTGARHLAYDGWGRLIRIDEAGLRQTRLRYDDAGRLTEREVEAAGVIERTRLTWQAMRLVEIEHPVETVRLSHDSAGRLTRLERQGSDGPALIIDFKRDAHGRLIERGLGDGLSLRYDYDRFGRPARFGWAPQGSSTATWLLDRSWSDEGITQADRALEGRLIRTETVSPAGRAGELAWRWRGQGEPLAFWRPVWRADGELTALHHRHGEDRFGYDPMNRLIVRERSGTGSEFFLYSLGGDLLARRDPQGRSVRTPPVPRDALGRPLHWQDWQLRYGVSGRIEQMSRPAADGVPDARIQYRYNALGERVSKRVTSRSAGERVTGFMHVGQRLAAELDQEGRITRHYLYWQGQAIAILDVDPQVPGRVRALHHLLTDHLGTPHRAIDRSGRVMWEARYDSYGSIREARGPFRQPLRFPGQYHDEETGLYDNYLRTYDPVQGRYLEPDPLGLAAGLNRHAYVGGRPHRAADPLGLILFAFDGTDNGSTARAPDTLSNVARLFSLYEGDDGHYMSGVGVDDPATGIRATLFDRYDAGSARARVDAMLAALDRELREPNPADPAVQVDVIGFSRGAAMARDFANTVASRIRSGHYSAMQRCVNLNFVGLWDTVAQFGLNGIANERWNLAIPDEARVVVHAVAANEQRRFFPLESILSAPPASSSDHVQPLPPAGSRTDGLLRIEQAFIGDHADIGGSHAEGDLADVTLSWMVRHAQAAGIDLAAMDPTWQSVERPFVHDARSLVQLGPDREVRYGSSATVQQKAMEGAGLSWKQATEMIRFYPSPRVGEGVPVAGEVDRAAYGRWLDEQYGLQITH
ncbi:MAG: hypothetical protein RL322_1589 [Pseudomonadota bacterium]|jgi:RHS repeat-associated protein